jgi:hypothetical protein
VKISYVSKIAFVALKSVPLNPLYMRDLSQNSAVNYFYTKCMQTGKKSGCYGARL